jgi:hypothetical protein
MRRGDRSYLQAKQGDFPAVSSATEIKTKKKPDADSLTPAHQPSGLRYGRNEIFGIKI